MSSKISWSGRQALFAFVITLPAGLVIVFGNAEAGIQLLVGSLIAAIVGLAPTRRQRLLLPMVGALFAVSVLIGSAVAPWWWLAIPVLFGLAFGAAKLASRVTFGGVLMTMGVGLAGIGLSYPGVQNSIGLATVVFFGTLIATVVAMIFPEYKAPAKAEPQLLPKQLAGEYGLRLGLAAATGAALGYLFHVDHIGWIVGSTLFVMRPNLEVSTSRALGRILSVIIGALLASWLLSVTLTPLWVGIITVGALVIAAATNKSEWYIAPAFTTFIVFWSLLYGDTSEADIQHRFWQRVIEVGVGILIAVIFGIIWPRLAKRFKKTPQSV